MRQAIIAYFMAIQRGFLVLRCRGAVLISAASLAVALLIAAPQEDTCACGMAV